MKKNKNFSTPIEVLQGLLGESKGALGVDFQRFKLKTEWVEIVGETIASKCSPVRVQNKILYVWVVSSSWMNQLFYVRREMIKKINQVMGPGWIKDLRFTLDHKSVASDQAAPEDQQQSHGRASPNEDEEPPRDR